MGAIVISVLAYPLRFLGIDKFQMGIAVRCILAIITCSSLRYFLQGIRRNFGDTTHQLAVLMTVSQFHVMFYASRLLPNTYCFGVVMLAMGALQRGRGKLGLTLLGIGGAAFRLEAALLSVFMILTYSNNSMRLVQRAFSLLKAGVATVIITVPIDSLLWRRLIWPEFAVFYFNIILNKSHEWGTSPWHWYWTSGLLNVMPFAYPTALLGLLTNNMMFKLCAPHLGVMAVLSCLSHKEMRFIFFIIPILNVAAAHFLSQGLKIKGSRVRKISKFFTLALLVTQTLATVFKVYISMKNYPGGVAILDAQKLLQGPARLHIDFFAAQNGVSRFTELNNNWIFDKAEDLKPEQYDKYAYLLTKSPAHHITKFEVVGSWLGYDGLRPNFKGWIKDPVNSLPIQLRYAPKVYFMKRKDLVNSQ